MLYKCSLLLSLLSSLLLLLLLSLLLLLLLSSIRMQVETGERKLLLFETFLLFLFLFFFLGGIDHSYDHNDQEHVQ